MSEFQSVSLYTDDGESHIPANPTNDFRDQSTISSVSISNGRMEANSESVSRSSTENFKKAQETNINAWRSTATNRLGMPVSQLTGDTRVIIGGMESTVNAHILAGNLKEDGKGSWELTESIRGINTEKPSHSEEVSDEINQPPEITDTLNKALEPFSDHVVTSMMPRVVDSIAKGEDITTLASQLSQMANMNQDDALVRMNHVVSTYTVEAEHKLSTNFGLDKAGQQELYAFARENPKGQQLLNEAINKQVGGRSMSGWKALVDHYFNSVPPSNEALKKAGIPTKTGSNNETLIKMDGNWVNLKTAVNLGWI
jgi:hypothetical protein